MKNSEDATVHEIERKFLIARLPLDLATLAHEKILQGYILTDEEREVRLRRKGANHFLTIKSGTGLSRQEAEISLTAEQFHKLWPLTAAARIEKVRYILPQGGCDIELDIFEGALAGLMIAEVEFNSFEDAAVFPVPEWFGTEVTDDERYKNKHLALSGNPEDRT